MHYKPSCGGPSWAIGDFLSIRVHLIDDWAFAEIGVTTKTPGTIENDTK
jgi:hypothetical protein